jgi:glutathione S-transferase
MKLLFSHPSPYARKCRLLVHEKGLQALVEEVESHPFEDEPLLLKANPLGRIPALILEDGRALVESGLICAFLDSFDAGPQMIPAGPGALEEARFRALADGLMDLTMGRRVERERDEALYSDFWISRRENGVRRALDQLEDEAAIVAETLNLASATLATALGYLDFRWEEYDWREGRPALTAHFDWWAERESFKATAPKPYVKA